MPRRNRPERREPKPDPKFNDVMIGKFINHVMLRGKKSVAERIVYDALERAEGRLKKPAMEIFEGAIRNATPLIEVKPRRVGGATYQVPMEIRPERRTTLAMRWIIQHARRRPGKSMAERLASELMDAYNNQGSTIKRKEDTHRMAEANRAFAHYRW